MAAAETAPAQTTYNLAAAQTMAAAQPTYNLVTNTEQFQKPI